MHTKPKWKETAMSERRPHWDDDLINAVIDLQYHCVDCIEYDYPDIYPRNHDAVNAAWAYGVIAAVEDWARWEHVPKGTLARIERVKDYCERRREGRGGDLTALDVLRLLHGSPVVGDLSSQADDGQRLDVNALLSARMEQVERAKRAEAEVERLNRIISESKPWIDMADELADAQATIQRVRDDIERRLALSENPDFGHLVPVETLRGILRTLDGDA